MDKICTDCTHHISQYTFYGTQHGCNRNLKIDVVSGEFIGKPLDCEAEREDALRLEQSRCCYEDKYYQLKDNIGKPTIESVTKESIYESLIKIMIPQKEPSES